MAYFDDIYNKILLTFIIIFLDLHGRPKDFFELVEDWIPPFKIDCFTASLFGNLILLQLIDNDVGYDENYVRIIRNFCLLRKSLHLTGCKNKWIFAYLVNKYRGTILYDVMKRFTRLS